MGEQTRKTIPLFSVSHVKRSLFLARFFSSTCFSFANKPVVKKFFCGRNGLPAHNEGHFQLMMSSKLMILQSHTYFLCIQPTRTTLDNLEWVIYPVLFRLERVCCRYLVGHQQILIANYNLHLARLPQRGVIFASSLLNEPWTPSSRCRACECQWNERQQSRNKFS